MNRCLACNEKLNKNKTCAKVNFNGELCFVCYLLCQSEFEDSAERMS